MEVEVEVEVVALQNGDPKGILAPVPMACPLLKWLPNSVAVGPFVIHPRLPGQAQGWPTIDRACMDLQLHVKQSQRCGTDLPGWHS